MLELRGRSFSNACAYLQRLCATPTAVTEPTLPAVTDSTYGRVVWIPQRRALLVAAVIATTTVSMQPVAADGPGYRFFRSAGSAKSPGAYWNPCGVIRYGIDFTYAQKAGLKKSWERDRWRSAVNEVATAMGVRFRYAGAITSRSARTRPTSDSNVDVIITFGNAKPRGRYGYRRVLKGPVAGVAGVQWRASERRNRRQVFGGYVVIDAKEIVRRTSNWQAPPDPRSAELRSPDVVRALYMHEFGHAVGLDHVRDKRQLMYPRLQADRADTLGAGDRKGLRKLGKQRCF